MSKPLWIRLSDSENKVYHWSIKHFPEGWRFLDHDNVDRYAGEKWCDLVYNFKLVAENYGFTLQSKLD